MITAINGANVNDIATFYRLLREKIDQDKQLWFDYKRGDTSLESSKIKR
jgi:hypothetical protein